MKTFETINKGLFIISLMAFTILGIITVGAQIIGLFSGNGDLMVYARKAIFPYGVLGSTIAGFLSFISPYLAGKKKAETEL